MKRRLVTFLVATVAALAALPGAAVPDGGGNNPVLVFNEEDDAKRSGARIVVSPTGSDTVDNENLAYAKSSCERCRTVAAAMQAVLITSNASDIRPKNVAVAVNADCDSCRTFAAAYQYVATTGGPVYLDDAARQRIANLRGRARAAAASDLSFDELETRLDEIYADFKATIKAGLREAGHEFEGTSRQRTDIDR